MYILVSNILTNQFSTQNKLPSVELHSGFPPKKVDLKEYIAKKSVIIVGLPGAFTPTWSNAQVPSYVELQDSLHDKAGIDEIIIYCVNDGAVMSAWAADLKVAHSEADDNDGRITFLGDPAGSLTKSLDMEMTHEGPASVGIIGRCKRFAVYAVNGEVKYVAISEADNDPAGDDNPEATLAPAIMDAILKVKDEL